MKPYWKSGKITIYHGDCLVVLEDHPDWYFSSVVTDPPYGIDMGSGDKRGPSRSHGLAKRPYANYSDSYENFVELIVPRINLSLDRAERAAVFTGPHIQEQRKAVAFGGVYCPVGSGRHAWGFKTFHPVLLYGVAPDLHKGAKPTILKSNGYVGEVDHPCPKPLVWMLWLTELTTRPGEWILDPFMGSGTTGLAAFQTGRAFVGIELDERYCEVAAARLEKEMDNPTMFSLTD